jgi:hypothetical protein
MFTNNFLERVWYCDQNIICQKFKFFLKFFIVFFYYFDMLILKINFFIKKLLKYIKKTF